MLLMLVTILIGIAIILVAPTSLKGSRLEPLTDLARGIGALIVILSVLGTSYVFVEGDETGHIEKVYGTSSLEKGAIIATQGEKGYQADVLAPGFQFSFLINILNNVTKKPVVVVPNGKVGLLLARD